MTEADRLLGGRARALSGTGAWDDRTWNETMCALVCGVRMAQLLYAWLLLG